MKIALAQINPIKGDIAANIIQHKKWIHLAISNKAHLIIFPELSITGYEPTLAASLAMRSSDSRFDDFQALSDEHAIIIGIGAPIQTDAGINISLVLFHPNQSRQIYAKKYLHADELLYFISGKNRNLLIRGTKIALAICYELSILEHIIAATKNGAKIYLSSVAKTENSVQNAAKRLKEIAKKHDMTTLMVNCVGFCDNFEAAGQSAVWDSRGELLGQLADTEEGLLVFDSKIRKAYSINK